MLFTGNYNGRIIFSVLSLFTAKYHLFSYTKNLLKCQWNISHFNSCDLSLEERKDRLAVDI